MRFRTDSAYVADLKASGVTKRPRYITPKQWRAPAALPGDVWRVHWHSNDGEGPIAGYDICCIKCKRVHAWTTALNCATLRTTESGWRVCDHSGKGSCWTWTGSAEAGTLTASPSLHASGPGGCGYHGFLINGVLSP